jgi:hypothetical protein
VAMLVSRHNATEIRCNVVIMNSQAATHIGADMVHRTGCLAAQRAHQQQQLQQQRTPRRRQREQLLDGGPRAGRPSRQHYISSR